MLMPHHIHPNDAVHYNGYIGYYWGKYCVSRRYKPDRILEIGIRAGYSALGFLDACHDRGAAATALYVGLDAENGTHGGEGGPYMPTAAKNLTPYKTKLIMADTQTMEALIPEVMADAPFDLIHVDGDHSMAGALHDLELVLPALSPKGIILVDDYDRAPAVVEATKAFLKRHPDLKHKYLESFNGDLIITKGAELDPLGVQSRSAAKQPEVIDSWKAAKLTQRIKPGERVLIRFGHGLGDTIMFMPIFEKLKQDYPETEFQLYLECGQEDVFPSVSRQLKDGDGFDKVAIVHFPMSEHTVKTKQHYCCEHEIGIGVPDKEVAELVSKKNPFVACHFHGTALPGSVGCPEDVARKVWQEVIDAGCIPIEVHFQHVFHNPVNTKPGFVDRHVRDLKPDISLLWGILAHCRAFIGVASGPFVSAMGLKIPVTYLENQHRLETYTREPIHRVDVKNYKSGSVRQWLATL